MKKMNLFALAAVLLAGHSCTSDEFSGPQPDISEPTAFIADGDYRSYAEVLAEAGWALEFIDSRVETRSPAGRRRIAGVVPLGGTVATRTGGDGEEEIPLAYIVNFENEEGFTIISTPREAAPVLAVTEAGNLYPGDTVDNPGMGIALGLMEDYLVAAASGVIPGGGIGGGTGPGVGTPPGGGGTLPNPGTGGGLSGNPDGPATGPIWDPNDPSTWITPGQNPNRWEYGNWVTHQRIGTKVPVKWSQDYPYNKYCPKEGGKNSKVGCVAVAMAQIMAYYKYPTSYKGHSFEWGYMNYYHIEPSYWTYGEKAENMIARLMQQLGTTANLNMDYGLGNSSAKDKDIRGTFQNFGYRYGGRIFAYSHSEAKVELQAGRPMIAGGYSHMTNVMGIKIPSGGHDWVLDEIWIRKRTARRYYGGQLAETTTQYEEYVHCNWGWGGSFDGYFNSGVFNAKEPAVRSSDKNNYYKYDLILVIEITK